MLEAQNLRIPVITSDIPILREVAGEGALYFDLQDPATLAHCLLECFAIPTCVGVWRLPASGTPYVFIDARNCRTEADFEELLER